MQNALEPEVAAGINNGTAAPIILDKRQFAARWQFSARHVDNLLSQGLPHLKIGQRRVRIMAEAGDRWMVERFGTQRIGPAGGGQ